jgi:hypothetical protein
MVESCSGMAALSSGAAELQVDQFAKKRGAAIAAALKAKHVWP